MNAPYRCTYCGAPSWREPSDQEAPADYCGEAHHGEPDDSIPLAQPRLNPVPQPAIVLLHPVQAADPAYRAALPSDVEYRVMARVGGPSVPLATWLNSHGDQIVPTDVPNNPVVPYVSR